MKSNPNIKSVALVGLEGGQGAEDMQITAGS